MSHERSFSHEWGPRWTTILAVLAVVGCQGPEALDTRVAQRAQPAGRGHTDVQAIAVILPPMIDGKLDEGIWRHTPGYSDFVAGGGPTRAPLRRTEVRVAYDAVNLYIALRCEVDPSVGVPAVRHWQDDDEAIGQDESCRVLLWPHPAPPGAYYDIAVNPEGVVCDARRHWDYPLTSTGWNGPTQSAATKSSDAWQAELRIPLKWLGIPDRPWHINVIRHDAAANERSSLAPAPSSSPGDRPPTAILRWPAPAMPFESGPFPVRQVSLADMERTDQVWQTRAAVIAASRQHAINGQRSLQVSYQSDDGAIALPLEHNDFSGWQTLRFGMFVQGSEAVPMGVRLRDVFGRTMTGWFLAQPGANDVALPLDLLGAGLRLRNIKAFEVVSRTAATVWIDHVRLAEDLLSYHERPNRPEHPSGSTLAVHIDANVVEAIGAAAPIGIDVTVPLFHTRRIRRLQHRATSVDSPAAFQPEAFVGHDLRDPVRVTAYIGVGPHGYFAIRDVDLRQLRETVSFSRGDFPPQLAEADRVPDAAP